jgi:hypothetical protein
LKFAAASVLESLRRNPELCNFVLNDISNNNDTTSYGFNCLSLTLPEQQQQPFGYIIDDPYTALILVEAEKLYNELITKLTNSILSAASVSIIASSLPLDNNRQKLSHKNDAFDETEEHDIIIKQKFITITKSNQFSSIIIL